MIRESVAYLVAAGRKVIFDAEHFYDGWKQDAEYALLAAQTAVEAGAASVTLCDTNGGSMTDEIAAGHRRRRRPAVRARRRSLPQRLRSGRGQHAGGRRGRGHVWCKARSTASASDAATPISISVIANLSLKKRGYELLDARRRSAG